MDENNVKQFVDKIMREYIDDIDIIASYEHYIVFDEFKIIMKNENK